MTVYHEIRVRLPYGPPKIQSTFGGVVERVTMPDCQSGGGGSSPLVTADNLPFSTMASTSDSGSEDIGSIPVRATRPDLSMKYAMDALLKKKERVHIRSN